MKIKAKSHGNYVVTPESLAGAIRRGKARAVEGVHAASIRYMERERAFNLVFKDMTSINLPVGIYSEFSNLSESELRKVRLGVGGSAVVLDDQDMHVSIAGLIRASEPLRELASAVHATWMGSKTSDAKAASSRQNGSLGGRPRKVEPAI